MRRALVSGLCAALSFVPATGSARPAPTSYRDCFVQEVHAPFPAAVVEESLPAGFKPAPYGSLPPSEFADSAGTTLTCRYRGKKVAETWWWVGTIPPKSYRAPSVDAYGFLIKAFAERGAPVTRPERRCMRFVFEPASVDMTVTTSSGTEIAHSVTTGEFTDEMRTEVWSAQPVPSPRLRLFGVSGGVRSFDVIIRGTALGGAGSYVQRGGPPDVGGSGVAVPGYFAGTGLHVSDARVTLHAAGASGC